VSEGSSQRPARGFRTGSSVSSAKSAPIQIAARDQAKISTAERRAARGGSSCITGVSR
jgi:hypothetical protein